MTETKKPYDVFHELDRNAIKKDITHMYAIYLHSAYCLFKLDWQHDNPDTPCPDVKTFLEKYFADNKEYNLSLGLE